MTSEDLSLESRSLNLPFGSIADFVRGFKESAMRSLTSRENIDPVYSEMEFAGALGGYLLTFPILVIQEAAKGYYNQVFGGHFGPEFYSRSQQNNLKQEKND